jgi:hypothetical protein
MNNLASILTSQGKNNESEPIYRQTLQLREKALSVGHPETLMTISNFAAPLQRQGKYNGAEPIQHRRFS